jgi:hypothetical protein
MTRPRYPITSPFWAETLNPKSGGFRHRQVGTVPTPGRPIHRSTRSLSIAPTSPDSPKNCGTSLPSLVAPECPRLRKLCFSEARRPCWVRVASPNRGGRRPWLGATLAHRNRRSYCHAQNCPPKLLRQSPWTCGRVPRVRLRTWGQPAAGPSLGRLGGAISATPIHSPAPTRPPTAHRVHRRYYEATGLGKGSGGPPNLRH